MKTIAERMADLPDLEARVCFFRGALEALPADLPVRDLDGDLRVAFSLLEAEIRACLTPPTESRTWIRQLREAIESSYYEARADPVRSANLEIDRPRVLAGFDRMLAELVAVEDRTAERISVFLEELAKRAGSFHVQREAKPALNAAAQDVRDGRWR